jgi:hypothetical protein
MQNAWKSVCVEVVIRNQPARSFFGPDPYVDGPLLARRFAVL